MSTYTSIPKSRKIPGPQQGLRRVTLRDRHSVGCPKVLEVWLPIGRWSNMNVGDFVRRLKDSCGILLDVDPESLDLDLR